MVEGYLKGFEGKSAYNDETLLHGVLLEAEGESKHCREWKRKTLHLLWRLM
jgi:hypothetical protein